MIDRKTFGKRVRKFRTEKQISQNDLGEHLGIGKSAISMIESGQRSASIEVASAIADFFEVPTDYLLGRGVFANWDELMEDKRRLLIIASIESHFPELKKLGLSHADERKLMKVLPSFIALIEFSDDMKESSIIYKL